MIKGYLLIVRDRAIFLKSEASYKVPTTVKAMMKAVCEMLNFSEEATERLLNDQDVYKRIQSEMIAAQLEVREGPEEKYFHIEAATIYGAYPWESIYLAKAA